MKQILIPEMKQCVPDIGRAGIIYTFLISMSAFKILQDIDIVTSCHSPVSWLYVELLNFENQPINKDFKRTFVNKHKMNIYVSVFSLCD